MINSTCEKLIDAIHQRDIIKINEIVEDNSDNKLLVDFYKMTQDEQLALDLIKIPKVQKNLAVYLSNQEMLILAHHKAHKQLASFILNFSIEEYKRRNRLFLYLPHIVLLMMGYVRVDGQYTEKSNRKIELLAPLLEQGIEIRIPASQMNLNIKMFEKTFSSIEFFNFAAFSPDERTFLGGLTYLTFGNRADLTHLQKYTKSIEGIDKIILTLIESSFKTGSRHLLQECNSLQLKERFKFLMTMCPQLSAEEYLTMLRQINENYRTDLLEQDVREKTLIIYNTVLAQAFKSYPDLDIKELTQLSEPTTDEKKNLAEIMLLLSHAAFYKNETVYERVSKILQFLISSNEVLHPLKYEPSQYVLDSFEHIHKISLLLGADLKQKLFNDSINYLALKGNTENLETEGVMYTFIKNCIMFGIADISRLDILQNAKISAYCKNLYEYVLLNGKIEAANVDDDFRYKV